ncbi:hypothetical protein ACWELJ_12515 [Nocardia sp. NPDC004582]
MTREPDVKPLDRLQSAALDTVNAALAAPLTTELVHRATDARDSMLRIQDSVLGTLNLPTASEQHLLQGRVRAQTRQLEDLQERVDELTAEVRALWAAIRTMSANTGAAPQ